MNANSDHSDAARLWVVLARAHHAVAAYMEQSIVGLGIGLTDFAVLEVLLHKGPLSMQEIARKVLLANASTTSAIDRMALRGLVQRNLSSGDRRVRMVALTEEGRTVASRLFAQHERDVQFLLSPIGEDEREMLRSGLKRIGLRAADLVHKRTETEKEKLE